MTWRQLKDKAGMDILRIKNAFRNRAGRTINRLFPPKTEIHHGSGDAVFNLIFVAPRWGYKSRFVGDGFEYMRFIPAFKRLVSIVCFVPIENKKRITTGIRNFKKENEKNIVFSVFQNHKDIPEDYFKLSQEGFYLANWYTDDDMFFDKFSKHVADRFNLNITTFEPNLARYKAINANAITSQWAGISGCDFLKSRRYAACFVGRMYGQRTQIVKELNKVFGELVFVHDTRLKPISEDAMISAYQNSWLAIDEPLAYDGKTRQIKARLFENASMGCLVLTKPSDRIEHYFEPNKEILFWETSSELIDIIRDCIDNPNKYKVLARLAYERTLREHLYEHRFREVFKQCWR